MLQHHHLLLPDVGQHGGGGIEVRHPQALHAAAAVAVVDLGEDVCLSGHKIRHLLRGSRLAVQRLPVQVGAERLVEAQLVVKIVVVGGVVHQVKDLAVADAGEIGVPLLAGQVVKAVHGVVVVPRTVAGGAPEDVKKRGEFAVAGLLLDHAEDVVQLLPADAGEDAGNILDVGRHGGRSFLSVVENTVQRRGDKTTLVAV